MSISPLAAPSTNVVPLEPKIQPVDPVVIYRKARRASASHHGGAWKIAYADFVTAMMAFFMLLWIIGATNEDRRKGIADYFTPTVVQMKNSGGSNGIFGGRSFQADDGTARANVAGNRPTPAAAGGGGGPLEARVNSMDNATAPGNKRRADEERFSKVERIVNARLAGDPTLKGLKGQIRFVRTRDGLRIDIVERADFSMFGIGSSVFTAEAGQLMRTVALAVAAVPNAVTVRGHTDGVGFDRAGANNWTLSTARADASRRVLTDSGVATHRFRRIEGVADTDPFNPKDRLDPRNRRISVTLLYRDDTAPLG